MSLRKKLVVYLLLCMPLFSAAQKSSERDSKKYKEEAEAIRKEVWAWNKPEFKVRTIPQEFANASSIVIARHSEINADAKTKAYVGFGFGMYRESTITEILREAVKINDNSAISKYSELSYTQMENKSFLVDVKAVAYVGVRVVKSDGKIKEINADDIVLTKDEKKEKQAKVAIPDLQVGDIVDYFIAKRSTNMTPPPYLFTFFDDSPVLSFSIHCEVGKKYAVEYRCYNGAPDFKQSKGDDDNNVLEVSKKNIAPITENSFWVSPYRQLPIIRMNIMLGYKGMYAGRLNTRRPGEIFKNQNPEEFVEDEINTIAMRKYELAKFGDITGLGETSLDYYKKIKKNFKSYSTDSIAAELYYIYRFNRFLDIDANSSINKVLDIPNRAFGSDQLFYMGNFFKAADLDNKMILLTSKFGPDMKGIMSKSDIAYMILVEGNKPRIFGSDDIFAPAFYVPPYFEGTKQAITLDTKGNREIKPKNYDQGVINVPSSSAADNAHIEHLQLTPVLSNNKLQVKRKTILRGHYKSDVQKNLVLFEDYYEYERKYFGQEKTLIEQFEDGKRSKKYADELKAAFAEARKNQKKSFEAEAKEWYEQEITDLANYKIENMGVRHNSPDFVYSSDFNMDGIIKKAGNNYILDIGKIQGSPLKLQENQRNRTLDVYAPFARSLQYQITLAIPDGYTVDGVANLNKKVENETGSFVCDATTDGKQVIIKLNKVYKNAFEPVGNWAKMLAFIDAANEWTNAKLLLKKK